MTALLLANLSELPGDPGVPVKALLASEVSQACGLEDIAVVAGDDVELKVESAESDESHHVIEADRCAAGFPSRDPRLGGACDGCEFLLGQAGAAACFADEVSTVGTHEHSITVLLYTRRSRSPEPFPWVSSSDCGLKTILFRPDAPTHVCAKPMRMVNTQKRHAANVR